MEQARPNFMVRFLPSLTDVAFLLPIFFLFAKLDGCKTLLGDGDTGWHVRTGEWILANGRVPDKDIFSFTKAGEPWFAWEWLWDLIFGWMHQRWGMAAVCIGSMLVICVTFALLYRLARRKCGNVLVAFGVTALAAMVSSIHWLARPHLFTLLFLVIFYSILERVREGRARLLWLLPPLTVLWTNLHGGFFVGIALIAAYVTGDILRWVIDSDPELKRKALLESRPLVITGIACALASLINPYTYKLHLHIYNYFVDPFHRENVVEFLSTNFHHPGAVAFECLIVLAVVGAIWNARRRRFEYCLLLLVWVHLALYSARNLPILAILACPAIALMLSSLLADLGSSRLATWIKRFFAEFRDISKEFGLIDAFERVPVVSALGFAAIAALVASPSALGKARPEYDPKKYPAAVVEKHAAELADRTFADDEWGDYLIYRLYPNAKVFVDGRSDFYGSKFEERYLDVARVRYNWERVFEEYQIRTVLVRADAALSSTLKASGRWTTVYDDSRSILFRRKGPAGIRIAAQSGKPGSPPESVAGLTVVARSLKQQP